MLINVKQKSGMIYSEPDPSVVLMTAETFATVDLGVRPFSGPAGPGEERTLTVPTNT